MFFAQEGMLEAEEEYVNLVEQTRIKSQNAKEKVALQKVEKKLEQHIVRIKKLIFILVPDPFP